MSIANPSKKATMNDVAKKAGVTIGTVSHVINGTAPISKATTAKVLKAIKELSYTPNRSAVALRTSHTKTIGLMLPDVTNSYYSVISDIFTLKANEDGYAILIFHFKYDHDLEKQGITNFVSQNVDAILLWNGFGDEDILSDYLKAPCNPPLILLERTHKDFLSIKADNSYIVEQAVDMLCAKGYKDIGFISETNLLENLNDRYKGYLSGMKKNGLKPNPKHIHIQSNMLINNMGHGYRHFKKFIKEHGANALPDAFVIGSDMLAMGIMRAFTEEGIRIPEDIAVIGFDNDEFCDYTYPPLTSIDQNKEMIGRIVWEKTKQIINGEKTDSRIDVLQQIVERSSC